MIYVLGNNYEVLGILSNTLPDAVPFYEDLFTSSLTGHLSLTFNVPYNTDVSDAIIVEGLLIYRTPENKLHLMRITEVGETSQGSEKYKSVVAENCAIGDLSRSVVRPTDPFTNTYNLKNLLTTVLAGSGWSVGTVEVPDNVTMEFTIDTYTNTMKVLQDALDLWQVEPEFVVELDGLRIKSKKVNIYINRGKPLNTTFVYGVDIKDVSRVMNSNEVITTIIALGKAGEDKKKLTIETATDPLDPSWDGDFVRSGDMLYSKWALQVFGKGQHRIGLYENDDITDPNVLLAHAQQELHNRSVPTVSYTINLQYLKEYTNIEEAKPIDIGDDILVIDTSFTPELRIQARIVEKAISWANPENNAVTLGAVREVLQDPLMIIKPVQKKVSYSAPAWDDAAVKAQEVSEKVNSGVITNDAGVETAIPVQQLEVKDNNNQPIFSVDADTGTVIMNVYDDAAESGTTVMKVDGQNGASFTAITSDKLAVNGQMFVDNLDGIPYYNPDTREIEVSNAEQMNEVLKKMPKYIYRRTVIKFKNDITGVFMLEGFHGEGELIIALEEYSLYGSMAFTRNTCRIGLSASTGMIIGQPQDVQIGNYIHDAMIMVIGCPEITLYGLKIYGSDVAEWGVRVHQSNIILTNVEVYNCKQCIHGENSFMTIINNKGKAKSGYGLGVSACVIVGEGSIPQGSGGTSEAQAYSGSRGTIKQVTFTADAGAATPVTPQPITKRFYETSARSWRTVYNNWRSDNDVTQGVWDSAYGHHRGFWFFGEELRNTLNGKTITSIKLYVTRSTGAGYSTAPIKIVAHSLASASTGSSDPLPYMFTANAKTVNMSSGQSMWIDVTSEMAFLFSSGAARGFGIYTSSTSKTEYAKMLPDITVEVTYS
jgi:phage minor structural protein